MPKMQEHELRDRALSETVLEEWGLAGQEEVVEEALDRYTAHDDGKMYKPWELRRICEIALGLASRPDDGGQGDGGGLFSPEPTPGIILRSERLVEALQEDVKAVRSELEKRVGGDLSLPFEDYSNAVRWLEETAEKDPRRRKELNEADRDRGEEVRRQILSLLQDLGEIYGGKAGYHLERQTVSYAKPGEEAAHRVPVPEGSTLIPLARFASKLVDGSGFNEPQVVAFVLADLEPLEIPVTISGGIPSSTRLPSGKGLRNREVQLTIRDPDLSFEDLRKLYNRVRERFGVRGKARLNEKDVAIDRAVRKLGGPPDPPAKKEFWEKVAEEVGGYGNWRGPYQRWRDKLKDA